MKPKRSRRSAASSSGPSVLTSRPSMTKRPAVGLSRQPSTFMSVLLPEPDWPMMATYSPASMRRLTPSSARTSLSPSW
jgi:hypothetical protein